MFQNHLDWQNALADFVGYFDNHYPKAKVLQFIRRTQYLLLNITKSDPIPGAPSVFTDGSGQGIAGYTGYKTKKIFTPGFAAQKAELLYSLRFCKIFQTLSIYYLILLM